LKNESGVSLVEVLIALVVLLLVFMGLLQAALLGIDHNMRNILRDEAVNLAAMRMEEARSMPFDNVVTDPNVCSGSGNLCTANEECAAGESCVLPTIVNLPSCNPVSYPIRAGRNFRNIQNFPYGNEITANNLDTDTKQIRVLVRWEYKNECYTHSATTLRRR